MKKFLTILFLFTVLVEGTLQAIPAKRVVQTITQPDGTTLGVILQGDENFHYTTTIDGIMLKEGADGFMRYATVTAQGVLSAGEYIAHDPEGRKEEERAFVEQISTEQINHTIGRVKAMQGSSQRIAGAERSVFPSRGMVRGLIILVQYKDVKFSANNTPEEFRDMMNAERYSNNNATGSARDYFIDQSSGVFTPEFDVIGPVTLPENMSYYGGNNMFGQDQNPAKMIVDACYAADTLLNTDFSSYDFNDDGKVDLVYVIYAGYAEAQGGPPGSIWPHAWNLETPGFKNIRMDGKLIYSYACSSELNGNTGTHMDGIGTFCHEFSHCLGLPDIYDTRYTGMVGMGAFSLMDYGGYNNYSRTPAGYSAYERYSVGWLTPIQLNKPQKGIELQPMNASNQAYMLVSEQNPNEYYTIEYRQRSGWDTYLPGHGMMIVHVDYVSSLWENNIINSSAAGHPHLQIVPADNEFDDAAGDLFPGTTQNTSFTDESQPASTLYSGGFLGKPLSRIQEKDGLITFDFMHFIGTPVATDATDITGRGFTANWKPVKNASSYVLEIAACMTGRKSLSEEFGKFTKGDPTEADEKDVSNELDTYTQTNGWTGSEIYQAGEQARMGNKNTGGTLVTPLLDFTREKEFTLCCSVKGSRNLLNGYAFRLSDANGNILLEKKNMMTAAGKTLYWVFNTEAEAGRIDITTKAAATFDFIRIYDGNVEEELKNGNAIPVPDEYKKEVLGITDHSYVFAGLDSNKKYIYSVLAKMDEEISLKSNKVVVQTLTPTGVDTYPGPNAMQNKVYTEKGMLYFVADSGQTACVYTAGGLMIHIRVSREGVNEMALPTGLYVLAVGTERTKVYVP